MFSLMFFFIASLFAHWARGVGFLAYSTLEDDTSRRDKIYMHSVSITLTMIAFFFVALGAVAL